MHSSTVRAKKGRLFPRLSTKKKKLPGFTVLAAAFIGGYTSSKPSFDSNFSPVLVGFAQLLRHASVLVEDWKVPYVPFG